MNETLIALIAITIAASGCTTSQERINAHDQVVNYLENDEDHQETHQILSGELQIREHLILDAQSQSFDHTIKYYCYSEDHQTICKLRDKYIDNTGF